MTAEDLMRVAAERGLEIVPHEGRPLVIGQCSDAFIRVVLRMAPQIMRHLGHEFVPWERTPLLLREEPPVPPLSPPSPEPAHPQSGFRVPGAKGERNAEAAVSEWMNWYDAGRDLTEEELNTPRSQEEPKT